MTQRVRLGDLLVDALIITREQLDEVLEQQKTDQRRLGTLLVEAGLLTETQVTQILSQQLSVPWVSLYHVDFARQLLNLVPHELAARYCLVPIFVRRVRGVGQTLYVAMDDPSDETVRQAVAESSGLAVRAMIAPPSEIRAAIRAYYLNVSQPPAALAVHSKRPETTAQDPAQQPPETDSEPEPLATSEARSLGTAEQPDAGGAEPEVSVSSDVEVTPSQDQPEPGGDEPVSARQAEIPTPRRGAVPRMITLTLLDGTRIKLPARAAFGRAEPTTQADQLTARDMIAALRAVTLGADASEILGENPRWELLFASLLSILLKKHLVADWEFVDEYNTLSQV